MIIICNNVSHRVDVGIWYILRAQRGSHIPTLKPKYIPYNYMDPLGLGTLKPQKPYYLSTWTRRVMQRPGCRPVARDLRVSLGLQLHGLFRVQGLSRLIACGISKSNSCRGCILEESFWCEVSVAHDTLACKPGNRRDQTTKGPKT